MLAQELNERCQCIRTDRAGLLARLTETTGPDGAHGVARESLFAEFPIFVEPSTVRQIDAVVQAAHEIVRVPDFVRNALTTAPAVARVDQGTHGILYGYDFHLGPDGPRLIEINTNAGGALLNAALSETQRPCCDAVQPFLQSPATEHSVERALVDGFRREFLLARGRGELTSVAIVDESPESQFLYPEFVLFQKLLRSHGIEATIADPAELQHARGGLWLRGQRIDLVYNRLTDFYLEAASSRALRSAYLANEVVLTPHPRGHALYANKRHLAVFSDAAALRALHAPEPAIEILQRFVPRAELVRPNERERLFRERKGLFFKPLCGYAGKAAYRGDKLTRGKFDDILAHDYLAQAIVAPSERVIVHDGEPSRLKLDVRAYVVEQRVLSLGARLYQGQTTNFRTPGGGFATVLALPASPVHP